MPENYPEESIQHSEHGKSLESKAFEVVYIGMSRIAARNYCIE